MDRNTIEIAERLITDDRIPEKAVKDTIVHEILHSASSGFGHTGKWKEYATIMNDTDMDITSRDYHQEKRKELKTT